MNSHVSCVRPTCTISCVNLSNAFFSVCRYSVVKRADTSQLLLLATERTASMAAVLGTELESVGTFTGNVSIHEELEP